MQNLGTFKDYSDNTLKSVFAVGDDKAIIEMTLLSNRPNCDVVCVPTHHFCSLGCKMCHLTNNKLNKKMKPIVWEDFFEALTRTVRKPDGESRRTNNDDLLISFMGVGEPLVNIALLEEVFAHEQEIAAALGYNHVAYAIATMMPNRNLTKLMILAKQYNVSLKIHFSLHNPFDEKRSELIPAANTTIEESLELLEEYGNMVSEDDELQAKLCEVHRPPNATEIHYTLIAGENDGDEELEQFLKLLENHPISVKFIRFNPIHGMERSDRENAWISAISERCPNVNVKAYSPPGREVGSSCGEFTKHYYHEEIETAEEKNEFEEWVKVHQVFD